MSQSWNPPERNCPPQAITHLYVRTPMSECGKGVECLDCNTGGGKKRPRRRTKANPPLADLCIIISSFPHRRHISFLICSSCAVEAAIAVLARLARVTNRYGWSGRENGICMGCSVGLGSSAITAIIVHFLHLWVSIVLKSLHFHSLLWRTFGSGGAQPAASEAKFQDLRYFV